MAAFHGHGTFSGHAGVANDMAAFHRAKSEALGDLFRQTHAFEDFDAFARAHNAYSGCQFTQSGTYDAFFSFDFQHDGTGVLKPVQRGCKLGFQCTYQRLEVIVFSRSLQGQFDPPFSHFIAVDGEAGAVRATISHCFEHGFEELAELGLQRRIFQVKTHNSAHIFNSWAEDALPIGRASETVG
ncbi:hypothetical protein D3C80_1536630 [compost metagenome]